MKNFVLIAIIIISFSACKSLKLNGKISGYELSFPPIGSLNPYVLPFDPDTNMTYGWVYDLNASMSEQMPMIGQDFIIVPNKYGKIFAIDRKNGKSLGTLKIEGAIERAFSFSKNKILFATTEKEVGIISSYNLQEGSYDWSEDIDPVESIIALKDDLFAVVSVNGKVTVGFIQSGSTAWSFSLPKAHRIFQGLQFTAKELIGFDDKGWVYSWENSSGKLNYKKKLSDQAFTGNLVTYQDYLIITDHDGTIFAFHPETQSIIWKSTSTNGRMSSPLTLENNILYGVTAKRSLVQIHAESGKLVNEFSLPSFSTSHPVITPTMIMVSLQDKTLRILDKKTGKQLRSVMFDGRVKSPVFMISPTEGFVYVEDKMFVQMLAFDPNE